MSIAGKIFNTFGLPSLFAKFGRPVVYKSIADGLDHQLIAVISTDEGSEPESNQQISRLDRIKVRIGRKRAQVVGGLLIGGIPDPRLKDNLVDGDDVDHPFAFVQMLSQNENTVLLQFQRHKPERIGTGNITK